MSPKELLDILRVAERLKCSTRHCYTTSGRRESVAEHSWRIALMAMLLSGEKEFQDADMDKVIRMCLIHDLGEAFTGDVPTFEKTETDEEKEEVLYAEWVESFPKVQKLEFQSLLAEMAEQRTVEAKIYKALDKLEAVIQHDESDISTWIPLEYEMQLSYGKEQVQFSPYLREFKKVVDEWTREKIEKNKKSG